MAESAPRSGFIASGSIKGSCSGRTKLPKWIVPHVAPKALALFHMILNSAIIDEAEGPYKMFTGSSLKWEVAAARLSLD